MQAVCRICGASHAPSSCAPVGARHEGSVLFDLSRLGERDRRSLALPRVAAARPALPGGPAAGEEEPPLVFAAAPLPLLGATPAPGRWLLPLLLGALGAGCVAAITAVVLLLALPARPARPPRAPAVQPAAPAAPSPARETPRRGPPPALEEQQLAQAPRPPGVKARRPRRSRPRATLKTAPAAAPAIVPSPVPAVDPLDRLIDEALRKGSG